jgi:hypothetical protein
MLQKEGYVPVWLEPQLLDLYYNGFCNSVLWQLFHYVPLNMDGWQRMTEHHTMQMQWQVRAPRCGGAARARARRAAWAAAAACAARGPLGSGQLGRR